MVVISTKKLGLIKKNCFWYLYINILSKNISIYNYLKEINDIYAEKVQYQKFLKYFKEIGPNAVFKF